MNSLITLLLISNLISFMTANQEQHDRGISVTSSIACAIEDIGFTSIVSEHHLQVEDTSYSIVTDSTVLLMIYVINKSQDTVWTYDPIEARYHMGYNAGTILVPCPNGYIPKSGIVREGLEYWMTITFPINDEWQAEKIEFILELLLVKDNDTYPRRITSFIILY